MNRSFSFFVAWGSLMTAGSILAAANGCSGKTDGTASPPGTTLDGATSFDGASSLPDGATPPASDGAAPGACVPLAACAGSACSTGPDAGPLDGCDWGCPLAALCSAVVFQRPDTSSSGGVGVDASWSVNDVTAARCAIAALRDGTKGRIDWGSSIVGGLGASYAERLYVVDDRQVYTGFTEQSDSFGSGRIAGASLKPASFFDGCLDGGTPDTYQQCLEFARAPCP